MLFGCGQPAAIELMHDEMTAIIESVPEFAARVPESAAGDNGVAVEVVDGPGAGSKYEALSADARRGHGLAPSWWAYDEMAQTRDRRLFDALRTAMGKRKRCLGIILSTQAEDDEHPLSQTDRRRPQRHRSLAGHRPHRGADRRRRFRRRSDPQGQSGARHLPRRRDRFQRGRPGAPAAERRELVPQSALQPAHCRRGRHAVHSVGLELRATRRSTKTFSAMAGRSMAASICRRGSI